MDVKIIIGANYGDEGKGLATDYFGGLAKDSMRKTIGVLTNGTAQRGHTVTMISEKAPYIGEKATYDHVFQHLSSATFQRADTYICKEFAVNPIILAQELEIINNIYGFYPKVYIHPECKVVTPLDMLGNLKERACLGLHNTCGMGFWKTLERYEMAVEPLTFGEITKMSTVQFVYCLNRIYKYYQQSIPVPAIRLTDGEDNIDIKGLINHFVEDFNRLWQKKVYLGNDNILNQYDTVIFENGQGLLIGEQQPDANWDFCTPSNTGVYEAVEIIENNHLPVDNIEVCYISRTYLTRHGDGPLENLCSYKNINPCIYDFTNIPNVNQGKLRYGVLNTQKLVDRINADFRYTALFPRTYNKSIMLTHWNENALESLDDFSDFRIYISDGKTREDVRLHESN